jgi:hypothetical protein
MRGQRWWLSTTLCCDRGVWVTNDQRRYMDGARRTGQAVRAPFYVVRGWQQPSRDPRVNTHGSHDTIVRGFLLLREGADTGGSTCQGVQERQGIWAAR